METFSWGLKNPYIRLAIFPWKGWTVRKDNPLLEEGYALRRPLSDIMYA